MTERDQPYRMRRLTDTEMADIRRIARNGRKGPGRALDHLWDLILRDAENITFAEAVERGVAFDVSGYQLAEDQYAEIRNGFIKGRRLSDRDLMGVRMMWLSISPGSYETSEDESDRDHP